MSLREITDGIHCISGSKDSIFIVCASYEDRARAAVQMLDQYKVDHSVIFRSKEYATKGNTPANFDAIRTALQSVSFRAPQVVEFSIDRPIPSMFEFEHLCKIWQSSSPLENITVDITTFPRQELLLLLRVLASLPNRPTIRLISAEPEKYPTEAGENGVKSVRSVPGFGGVQPPGMGKLLIMLLGHEEERAAITWKRHNPKKTIVITSEPSFRNGLKGIVEKKNPLFFLDFGDTLIHKGVPARGINETATAILEYSKEYSESYFTVVAPYGTKLQALGVFKAARIQPKIQITYAVPSIYNYEAYSRGIGPTWELVPWS